MAAPNRKRNPKGLLLDPPSTSDARGGSLGLRLTAPGLSRLKKLFPGRTSLAASPANGGIPSGSFRLIRLPRATQARGIPDRRSSRSSSGKESIEAELYPAFVKLRGRTCLVVGGGPIALQKVTELLRAGATVRAVAREWPADFGPFLDDPRLARETREYASTDLNGIFLVVAATNDVSVQHEVWKDAERRGILCNVVDVPELCNFYVPASLRRGALTVSVSTAGKSPLFAVALRDRLARSLGSELGPALEILAEARSLVRARYPKDHEKRRAALGRLLTPEAIDQLMDGDLDAFEAHERAWTSSLSD